MNFKVVKYFLVIMALLMACQSIFAEESRPAKEVVERVERRGQQIADYERAAIRATNLLLASKPDESKLGLYVVVNKNNVWAVYFGKITENKFHFWYYYSCPEGQFDKMKPEGEFKDAPKDIYYFALAIDLATKAIEPDMRFPRYNTSVFREQDGTIAVYFLPGNTEPDVVLLGGDFKVSVSSDATKVLNKISLHESTFKVPVNMKEDQELIGGFHTHILDDLPVETDVALIILNPILAPHYVTGRIWMSKVDANGKISILGKTEEIFKQKTQEDKKK